MFPLAALGAGLGQFAQDYRQQQESALRQLQTRMMLQQLQREQQSAPMAWQSILGQGAGTPSMTPVQTPGLPQQDQILPSRAPSPMITPGGNADPEGMPAGSGDFWAYNRAHPDAMVSWDQFQQQRGQSPRVMSGQSLGGGLTAGGALTGDPLDLIAKYESGGRNIRQQILPSGGGYNPSVGRVTGPSSAQGPWQITDSTWRDAAPKAGVDLMQYPTAMSAPIDVQRVVAQKLYNERGFAPWAPYNSALRQAIGRGETADPIQIAQAQAQPAAQNAVSGIDPTLYGRLGLQALAQRIDKANPGADPVVKMMALERAQKLLAPDDQRRWEMFKIQHDDRFKEAELDLRRQQMEATERLRAATAQETHDYHQAMLGKAQGQPFKDEKTGKWYQVTGSGEVREVSLPATAVKPSSQAQQIPEELQYPDKWEGMPNKPPPNVRQDVWMAAMEYVRTGKMPALGFQPGMRNLVMQASPAAAHALGVDPARIADLQAQYAGMRHAQIVGGGRAAQIELGIQEATKAAPQVVETSKGVPRTQFPSVNSFANWLQEQGGSPKVVAFREALNTYLNVYASVVSRTGRLTDAQQRHAYELLSTAMNQGQIERGIRQLDKEMQLMKEAVPSAMEGIKELGAPPALRTPTTPAPTPQQQGARAQVPSWALDARENDQGVRIYFDRDSRKWVDENRKPVQ